MQLSFSNERVLAVVAHPDDAELLCAGTLARALADGAVVAICVLCRGDKGQPDPPIDDLAEIRRSEMSASADLLGADLLCCDFDDGELSDGPASRRMLLEIYRRFRPSLVLAHAANDYHPDHQAASRLAEAVSWFCASRGQQSGSPALDAPPSVWWMDTVNMIDFLPHFYIDVSDHVELKCAMLGCHASQLARGENADFSPLDDLMRRQCQTRGAQAGTAAAEAFRSHDAWKRARAW